MLPWLPRLGAATVADTVALAVTVAVTLTVTLTTRDASAVGGLLPPPGDPAALVGVRYAVAASPAQTTRWASLRFERFPGAVAWVLPVRPGARIEQVGDAWLESLDLATAPRVVESACAADAGALRVRLERSAGHQGSVDALEVRAVEDAAELRAMANAWALGVPADVEDRVEILHARGFRFVVLLYGGSADRKVTRTVRVTDDSFPAVPLLLTAAPSNHAVEVTAFLVGSARARVGAGVEKEIDPRLVSFTDAGSTTYEAALLGELALHRGASWVVEAADHAFFFDGVGGPAGVAKTEPLVRTYFERAIAYAEPSDDLGLALSGLDPGAAWITRMAGVVPANALGDDLAVTMTANQPKSPFVVTSPAGRCSGPTHDAGPFVGGMTEGPTGDAGVRETGTLVGPAPIPPGEGRPSNPVDPGGSAIPPSSSEVHGSMSCACSPGSDHGRSSSEDSCGHSDSTSGSSSEGCGGSPSDADDEEDGCGGSASDSSDDDGCDGSDPGDDPNDDGCDSGSSNQDDDGCDSSESRSSGEAKCAVTRRTRRGRVRTSPVVFALAAILLPLRRLTRPRPRRKGGTIAT